MAKQTSTITLSGKLGDHVHYHRGGKHFTKRASAKPHNFSPGSIASQQAFGLGSRAGKQLKLALKPVLDAYKYEGIHNRLTEACKQIFREGPLNGSASTKLTDHNINMLLGLNLNKHTPIDSLICKNPIVHLFEPSGKTTIVINEHRPTDSFSNKLNMEAISIKFLFSVVDFDMPSFTYHQTEDIIIPLQRSYFEKKQGLLQLGPLNNKTVNRLYAGPVF